MCKNSKENELKDLLIKIRRNKKTMRDLVELLEGNDYLDENKGDTEYQLFCEEYVSYIIQKYVSDEKDSIILKAIYGIPEEYKLLSVKERRKKLISEIHENDERIKIGWKDIDGSMSDIEDIIFDRLIKRLLNEMERSENEGKLNLAKEVPRLLKKDKIKSAQCNYNSLSPQSQRRDTTIQQQDPNWQELNINKPDLSAPVKVDIDADKLDSPVPPEPEDEIAKYIAKTQTASYHDEFSHEIYAALCHEGESPYSEWVATWLLKCIRETFGDSLDAEIMLASFALMVNYDLGGSDKYERRLFQYLRESEYYETRCKKPFRKINFNNLRPSEEEQLMEDLKQDEQELVSELVTKIDNITAPNKYVEDLAGYGKYVPKNNSYQPKIPKMLYRKKRKKKLQTFTILTVLLFSISAIKVVFILQEKNNTTTISDEYPSSKYVRGIDVGFNE